jgi:hypothetical protein
LSVPIFLILPVEGRGTMRSMVEGCSVGRGLGGWNYSRPLTPLRRAGARHLPSKGRIESLADRKPV